MVCEFTGITSFLTQCFKLFNLSSSTNLSRLKTIFCIVDEKASSDSVRRESFAFLQKKILELHPSLPVMTDLMCSY